ncbi:MAG: type IV pilin [Candidatus Thermoplasmatota archaeon]|nr:type IV pilin [Candidatus Thermoplasmatota archaeon]
MRRLNRNEEGVSPVIATILMVAITVVLAATLYMMLPSGSETDSTEALSGSIDSRSDGWLVEVNGGSVDWNADNIQLYNTDTGTASTTGSNPSAGDNFTITADGTDVWVVWNDNDGDGTINGGDSFRLTTSNPDAISNDWEFRVANTNLQLELE